MLVMLVNYAREAKGDKRSKLLQHDTMRLLVPMLHVMDGGSLLLLSPLASRA